MDFDYIKIQLESSPEKIPDWGSECIFYSRSKGFLIGNFTVGQGWLCKVTKTRINDVMLWQYTGYFNID